MAERILVIDDDAMSRDVLELLLVGEGYAVRLASSGDEALAVIGGGDGCPEVVLSDLQMPGVCGEELFRQLRTRCEGGLRVVAMSGSLPEAGVPEGADAFLLKPFSMEAFEEAMRGLAGVAATGSGPGETEGAAVLDTVVLESFRAMLGERALGELYGACVRDAEGQWARMWEANSAGNYELLRKFAHALKGSLGMVGARELEGTCLALEKDVVNAHYVIMLERFPDGIQRLRDTLNALGIAVSG